MWTGGDRDVALKMVFMYVANAPRFGWWQDIIRLEACKACADMYEVADQLTGLGIDVKYMGDVLTNSNCATQIASGQKNQ